MHSARDLTTKARIRDAALRLFPTEGFGATTIRSIARDAGVSPALVVHHFGSKEGLRQACDEHVVQVFGEAKAQGMQEENLYSRSFVASTLQMAGPTLRYLSWALSRGHPAAGDLFDDMVSEGIAMTRIAIDRGLIKDSPHLDRRVAVQMAMQLGAMVLSSHLERHLGTDITTPEGMETLTPVLLEVLGGTFEPEVLERLRSVHVTEPAP